MAFNIFYQSRVQNPTPAPFNNTITFAINSFCAKLKDASKKYNGKNDKKVKNELLKAVSNLEYSIFQDPAIYQLFLSTYMSKNISKMGAFRDKIKATSSKIKNLDFNGLTPDKVQAKVNELFEEDLKDDALRIANEINDDFAQQKKEVLDARLIQFKRYKEELNYSSPLSNLSYQEFKNLIENTPELYNTTPDQVTNIEPEVFERLAQADTVTIYGDSSFEHCYKGNNQFDMTDAKTCADLAKENGQSVHLGTMIESTSFAELPPIEYSADNLKKTFNLYLDNINNTFEEISSCTFFTDIIYDPKIQDESYHLYGNTEVIDDSTTTVNLDENLYQPALGDLELNNINSENLQIVSESKSEVTVPLYNPCVWQTLGDDWYIQLLEMGKEKMPDTKFYISESGIENPEKAKKVETFLNEVREYENEKEKKTGKACTLIDGICIPLKMKADEKTIENLESISSNLSVVIEGANAGFTESDQPIRFTEIQVDKVLKNEDGSEISEDLAEKRQKEVYSKISDLAVTYSSCISDYELGGFTDALTIDGSQVYLLQDNSSPYLFDESGQPKDEIDATKVLSNFSRDNLNTKNKNKNSAEHVS